MAPFDELTRLVYQDSLDALTAAARDDDLARRDAGGLTLLHHAARAASFPICQWLLARGADAAARDGEGHTPAALVYGGDPSCSPEEVAGWRALREFLLAAERARGAGPT